MKTAHEIATEAARLVAGDRQQTHGSKQANFQTTVDFWNVYLGIRKEGAAAPITATDFAIMMILAKISRAAVGHKFNIDNFVDMAGYAACAGEVALNASAEPELDVKIWNTWTDTDRINAKFAKWLWPNELSASAPVEVLLGSNITVIDPTYKIDWSNVYGWRHA